jgi:ketosteroid isomerase-like protein
MSEENIARVKELNAAFNRGDLEACAACYDERAEVADLGNAPDLPPRVLGREAIRSVMQTWLDAFDEFRADIEEYRAVGDHVICRAHWHGRGRGGGVTVDLRAADLYELRAGLIVRATLGYPNTAAALAAIESG